MILETNFVFSLCIYRRLLPAPPRLHHIFSHQENYEALLNLADTLGPGKPRGLEKPGKSSYMGLPVII